MGMQVEEFMINRSKTPGCCGMEIHHMYGETVYDGGAYKIKEENYSYEWLVEKLVLPKEKQDKYKLKCPWMIKPVVLVSGTDAQMRQKFSPHSFMDWVKAQGETVTESPWHKNYGADVKVYIWNVSEKFRNKLHEAYEAKHGPTPRDSSLSIAIAHHDVM